MIERKLLKNQLALWIFVQCYFIDVYVGIILH